MVWTWPFLQPLSEEIKHVRKAWALGDRKRLLECSAERALQGEDRDGWEHTVAVITGRRLP